MALTITRITPGRGRAGAAVTIEGAGFGTAVHLLGVTVEGIAATVVAPVTDEALSILVPSGITTARMLDVVVTLTPVTGPVQTATARWWSKATASALLTYRIPLHIYGPIEKAEGAASEHPGVAQAKDFERATHTAELLPFDVLTTKGDLAVRQSAGGLVRVAVGANGTRFVRDTASGSWRTRLVDTLSWGRQFAAGDTTEQVLCANGADTLTTSQGENQVVPSACRVALVSIACRRASPNTNSITRVRILVNGSSVFDTNTLSVFDQPDVRQGEAWSYAPWLSLSAGNRVALALTKNGSAAEMNIVARVITV